MADKKVVLKVVRDSALMLLACVCYGMGTACFLASHSIIAGGASGLAVLINILNSKIPIGAMTIAINVPILLLGLKYQGWRFILKCLVTIVILGLIMDLCDRIMPPLTETPMLAALYGGVLQGLGIGLFVRSEFSSGGTELLGRVIAHWIKTDRIPLCAGFLDAAVVIAGTAVTKNIDNMLYALIVIFVMQRVSDFILWGIDKSKLCIIITTKGAEVAHDLIEKSPRGVTMLDAKGMYTQEDKNVIITCVKSRQVIQLRKIVRQVDSGAFIIISDSAEVRGKGFKNLNG